MAVTAILVAVIAALVCSSEATLTWKHPVSKTNTFTKNIKEGTTVFTPPLIIAATTDAAKGTTITYELSTTDPFNISATTGEIKLTKALDYEATKKTYTLTIKAAEVPPTGGQPTSAPTTPKPTSAPTTPTTTPTTTLATAVKRRRRDTSIAATATATVTINVEDVPTFAKTDDSVCVPDGAKAGDDVAKLDIKDKFNDTATTYPITGKGNDKFNVVNGKVVVATDKNITKGKGDPYTLTIKQAGAVGTLTLKVTVGDCSAASLLGPLGLLTLLMALIATMN